MIAKIEPAFSSKLTLSRKIDYQLEKISSGEAKELFNSIGDSLFSFSDYMFLFSSLNDRVKLPYSEITLNLSPGERLSEANWINLSKEYMEKMGYGNCCYSIILNKDKEHSHVHILHSRIDSEGKSVSNSLDYKRSEKLARELEKKYNLVSLKENERTKERLSSISGQRYYFDNALKKALRNYAVKERVMSILSSSGASELLGDRLLKSKLSYEEWMSVLGNHEYDSILSILKKGGFLKSLYKDDLLSRLDRAFASSTTFQEFRANLQKEGVYEGIWGEKEMPADQKNEKKNERAACVQGVRDKADAIDEKDFFMKHSPELPFNFEETRNLPQNIKMPSKNFSENYWRRYRWIYRELVKLVDSHIGDILDAVDNNPKLKENTYIIFTSDHGEMLGAHKMITKGYPYEECQKVPFIISGPGIKHGDKDNSVVCNGTDILPTMSELANIKVGRTDGISLAKRITNKGDIPEREAIRIENNNFYTIVSGSYKYSYYDRKRMKKDIITLNEKNEFFVNTDKDPGEMRNSLNENRKHANELKRFVPLTK